MRRGRALYTLSLVASLLATQAVSGPLSGADRIAEIAAAASAKVGKAKLGEVNRAVNLAVKYVHEDVDYWQPAEETMSKLTGDCEDYATAKHNALVAAGFPAEDLKIKIVIDETGTRHAVLLARLGDELLILDNRRMSLIDARSSRYSRL
jgi:predicted transglutaminase-like cysteine proteinase